MLKPGLQAAERQRRAERVVGGVLRRQDVVALLDGGRIGAVPLHNAHAH